MIDLVVSYQIELLIFSVPSVLERAKRTGCGFVVTEKGNKKGLWENPEALDTSSRFCLFDGNFSIFDDDIVCVAVAKVFVDDDNAAYGHGVAHLG